MRRRGGGLLLGARASQDGKAIRVLPDLNVVKVGASSIIEQGRRVVMGVVKEIAEASRLFQLLITSGGGERHKHSFEVGLDLGMPAGVLALLGSASPNQNALILQALLAPYGGIRIPPEHFVEIPAYLAAGSIPITSGMPTYDYWEHPPKEGELPEHDTDVGAFLMAETFGARSVTLIKDVDGVYTADPKIERGAEIISSISTKEARDLPSLPFDWPVLDMLDKATNLKEVRVVNGHTHGALTAALQCEKVGTVVTAS